MACTIPMRVLIGVIVASIVLIVAIVTLVITYTVALSSLRSIAEELSLSLVQSARLKTENFFEEPCRHLIMLQNMAKRPGFMLPSDDNLSTWHQKYFDLLLSTTITVNNTYGNVGIVFEDGSGISTQNLNPPHNTLLLMYGSNYFQAASRGGVGVPTHEIIALNNMTNLPPFPLPEGFVYYQEDLRFAAYESAKSLFPGSLGFWYPMVGWQPANETFMLRPAAIALTNSSGHFLGYGTMSRDLLTLSRFLSELVIPGTHAFAVDQNQLVIASTIPHFYGARRTTSTLTPAGCLSSAATATTATYFIEICFHKASNFPFAPLASAASHPGLLTTDTQAVELVSASNGDSYYVVSSDVHSSFRAFKLNLVLIMPEDRVIGDIVSGRNTAIISTIAIFILASLLSFLLVYLLLKPLNDVSDKMRETARLREPDGTEELSRLTEVRNLQKSYYNMNAAIQSFTRYVPKDVVTDLMSSGQLCEIKMQEMRCSILFVDIRGFTTICERVPVEALSPLVTQYFDVMSKIVMKHDGLIDKYIGDCIMAVWGAPFPSAAHELKSTLCALLLHRETQVQPLAGAFDEAGEVLGVRVGVNTGTVLAGNMGSAARMNYTVIGDPVNLAARLESMNKQFGTQVMISEDTAERCGTVFALRLLMSIAVVGKSNAVKVYEVVALNPELSEHDRVIITSTEDAFHDDLESSLRTDSQSVASQTAIAIKHRNLHSFAMLRMDALEAKPSWVATEEDITVCQLFNTAVLAYLEQQFVKALELCAQAVKFRNTVSDCRINLELSSALLTDLCEKAINNPSSHETFFTSQEK